MNDVTFTGEHAALSETVREFCAKRSPEDVVRGLMARGEGAEAGHRAIEPVRIFGAIGGAKRGKPGTERTIVRGRKRGFHAPALPADRESV